MPPAAGEIAAHFAIPGRLIAAEPFRGGLINESHVLTFKRSGGPARYLLQRVNDTVFSDPVAVMENVERVTAHIARKLASAAVPDRERRCLRLVPAADGKPYWRAAAGACWRVYVFVENTRVHETVRSPQQAYQAARAFGEFQRLLADYDGPSLHETIPDFHNTPLRYQALERALQEDIDNRAHGARPEVDFALRRRDSAGVLLQLQRQGVLPTRIAHNDAKIGNVLLDRDTGEPVCVIDLDTVMPGLSLFDFGDMVRSMSSTAAEDERDLQQAEVQVPLFEAVAGGYLAAAGATLTAPEREQLVPAGRLITLEQGVRFLTDFLEADRYYGAQRPGHNLDRCRRQFRLVESLEAREAELRRIVDALA